MILTELICFIFGVESLLASYFVAVFLVFGHARGFPVVARRRLDRIGMLGGLENHVL